MKTILFFILIFNFNYAQKSIFEIAKNGTVEELKELYEKDTNCINQRDKFGFSPLIYACYKGNFEVSNYLINIDNNLDYQSKEGTALMAAVMKGNVEIIEKLIKKKANLDLTNDNGVTALMLAVQFKKLDIIKLLLKFNANVYLKDNEGKTVFEYAIATNDDTIIVLFKY